jgi:exopolysaccharide biosynthesis protein
MNAGFFDVHRGTCLGALASEGKIISDNPRVNAVFGITKDMQFVMGYMTKDDIHQLPMKELITGVGWLVRNGSVWIDRSLPIENPAFDFIWEKAPRTAIGHDKDGRLMLFEVDGDEPLYQGLDLYEWAELVLELGAVNAVNLDGGGSAVVVQRGRAVSKPSDHCASGVGRCERMVTTYICVK